MKAIYDKQGNIKDYHDDGKQAQELMSELEVRVAIRKLSSISKKIITLRLEGYTNAEIIAKLKIKKSQIPKAIKELEAILKI